MNHPPSLPQPMVTGQTQAGHGIFAWYLWDHTMSIAKISQISQQNQTFDSWNSHVGPWWSSPIFFFRCDWRIVPSCVSFCLDLSAKISLVKNDETIPWTKKWYCKLIIPVILVYRIDQNSVYPCGSFCNTHVITQWYIYIYINTQNPGTCVSGYIVYVRVAARVKSVATSLGTKWSTMIALGTSWCSQTCGAAPVETTGLKALVSLGRKAYLWLTFLCDSFFNSLSLCIINTHIWYDYIILYNTI